MGAGSARRLPLPAKRDGKGGHASASYHHAGGRAKKKLAAEGHVALYLNFDTDQATLRPADQPLVAEVLKLLQQNPGLRLAVQGHTDNAGTAAHNQQLSEARAQAVVVALTQAGIAADRLQAAGFGQTQPLADNATVAGRAQNRRVELVQR